MTDMTFETIEFSVEDGLARLTLNRPDKLNSFNTQMHEEVRGADAAAYGRADMSLTDMSSAYLSHIAVYTSSPQHARKLRPPIA